MQQCLLLPARNMLPDKTIFQLTFRMFPDYFRKFLSLLLTFNIQQMAHKEKVQLLQCKEHIEILAMLFSVKNRLSKPQSNVV